MSSSPEWIFGYGSLIWRPEFEHAESTPACIHGWVRRFWQGSTDHRGVPDAPGRVVTLVRTAAGAAVVEPATQACWGVAYRVDAARLDEVLEALDVREQGGYERVDVEVRISPAGPAERRVRGLVYVATEANENYLGPAPLDDISRQVMRSAGPSGPNPEYVTRLAEALRAMGAEDPHVFELDRLVRSGLGLGEGPSGLVGNGRRDRT